MADGWKIAPEHFTNAYQGILIQAKAHGLDTNNVELNTFLVHQAEVQAAAMAGQDFYANALNRMTMEQEND